MADGCPPLSPQRSSSPETLLGELSHQDPVSGVGKGAGSWQVSGEDCQLADSPSWTQALGRCHCPGNLRAGP